ncbi:aminotransferase class I/II-fold pyridoxal phosphate-dependent enzyme [Streptomyces anulatus]|uniref:aminotransferase class I/II-fold pyridoxal phosphate-dependent enzyme n=1 Tax=Streptomyces anulatus TaxID=1892 RepID=UPI00331EDA4E
MVIAAAETLRSGFTHYTPSRGISQLCEASAAKLLQNNRIVADPGTDIIVTPSARHAARIALAGVIGPGDEVLVPSPTWVSYAPMVTLLGGRPDRRTPRPPGRLHHQRRATAVRRRKRLRTHRGAARTAFVRGVHGHPGHACRTPGGCAWRRAPAPHRPTGTTSRLRARDRDITLTGDADTQHARRSPGSAQKS